MDNYYTPDRRETSSDSLATASLVFGILAVCTCFTVILPCINGALAIILGLLSRRDRIRGKALAGVISGIAGLLLMVGIIAASFYVIATEPELSEEFWSTYEEILEESGYEFDYTDISGMTV